MKTEVTNILGTYSTIAELIKLVHLTVKNGKIVDVWFENKWICFLIQSEVKYGHGGILKIRNQLF